MHRAHPSYVMYSRHWTARERVKTINSKGPIERPLPLLRRQRRNGEKHSFFERKGFCRNATPGGERPGSEALRERVKPTNSKGPLEGPLTVLRRKRRKGEKHSFFERNGFSKNAIPGGERPGTEALRDRSSIAVLLYILAFRSALSDPPDSGAP